MPSGDNHLSLTGVCFSLLQNFSATFKIHTRNWQITWKKATPKQTVSKSYETLVQSNIQILSWKTSKKIITHLPISVSHFQGSGKATKVLVFDSWPSNRQWLLSIPLSPPAHGVAVARLWPAPLSPGHSGPCSAAFPGALEKINLWTGERAPARNISEVCRAMAEVTRSLRSSHALQIFRRCGHKRKMY